MHGVHETWKGSTLWDTECAQFLGETGEGAMCRVVGSLRRKDGSKWEMVVKHIRQTNWDEVEYIAGIHT